VHDATLTEGSGCIDRCLDHAGDHSGGVPTVLEDAVARCRGRLIAEQPVNATALAQVGSRVRAAALSATPG
jgi:hypothetical protein